MKTIGINKGIKKMIEDVAEDGETVDATLSRLLDMVEDPKVKIDSTRTNIALSEETFRRMNDARLFSTESYISVIYRLVENAKK